MHMVLARNGVAETHSIRELEEYKRSFDASDE
jgi:hypothetical protein